MTLLARSCAELVNEYWQAAVNLVYGKQNPFEIPGSAENLTHAIKEHKEAVLQYKFKDEFQSYSAL